jgi:hypothetical protein
VFGAVKKTGLRHTASAHIDQTTSISEGAA